jgi:uncharacterized membrane protein
MRNTERLFLIALIPFTAVLGLVGHELSNMAIEAQVSQAAYQCENGDERVCYKLALWTGGDCASPRMIGGCQADSYVNDSGMIVSNPTGGPFTLTNIPGKILAQIPAGISVGRTR